jgi:predicted ATPase
MTLDVMRMMVTDPVSGLRVLWINFNQKAPAYHTTRMGCSLFQDVRHFLFIGAYRDNEVSSTHPLMHKLNELKGQGINVVNIKIGPIEKECVNTLVSEALCLPPNLCRPLSTVIHSKTGGIIMFLLRFLKSLNDEGLLWFSLSSRSWEFDLEKISTKQISADVVQHMTLNMGRLHMSIQNGLKTAACLGSNLDAEILYKAKVDDEFDVDDFLQKSVEDGYLIRIAGSQHYTWAHDQVHQAAYELIPIAKRESFHLLLGSRLLMHSPGCNSNSMLFYVVDNMNRGIKLLESPDQKSELAFLNLRAGECGETFLPH